MKKIEINRLDSINGGAGNYVDWVCGGVSVGALTVEVAGKLLASRGITLALGPIGWAVAGACTVYGLGRLADWW